MTDSLNTVSAYVIKYNLLSEPIYLNEHDSYIIDSEKEVIPISFNNSQARISVIGNDGCIVLTLMCPYDHPHPAGAGCIAEDRGDLYWVADSSGCGNGGGGSGSGNSGTPPGNGNSNGNQNGGGNGNGGTRSVSPIVTTPVGLDGVAIKDPCINAAQANQKSKNILNEPAFQQKLNQINGTIPTDTVEKGFTFGIRPEDNNFAVSEVQTGTATGINLPSTNPNFNVTGNIHTHPAIGFDSFSPSDFYGFTTANTANSNFSTMFVLGATGEVYSLTITDPVRFTNFATFYPMTDHFDPAINGWKKGSPIRDDFMGAFDNLYREQGKTTDEAYALANAYVLRKYNAGMSISKKNSNGDFETLFVEEKKDPNDDTKTIYEQTSTCNLKKKN